MLLLFAGWQSISECLHKAGGCLQILVVLFVLLSGQGMIIQVTDTGSSSSND